MLKFGRTTLLLAALVLGALTPCLARPGIITTAAGAEWSISQLSDPTPPYVITPDQIAIDACMNVYVNDRGMIRKFGASTGTNLIIAGGGTISSDFAEGLPANEINFWSTDFTVDYHGNVYLLDNGRIFKIDADTKIVSLIGGSNEYMDDYKYVIEDGQLATSGRINSMKIAVDPSGNVYYVAEDPVEDIVGGHRIRRIDAHTGIVTTVAGRNESGFSGDGKPAIDATFTYVDDLSVDQDGNIYIADSGSFRVRKVDAQTGIINTIAGNGSTDYTGDGVLATQTGFDPSYVALDHDKNVYISNGTLIWKVDARTGVIQEVAGNGSPGYSGDFGPALQARLNVYDMAYDHASDKIYFIDTTKNYVRVVDQSTGTIQSYNSSESWHFSGDNGPALSAYLYQPSDVVSDSFGNLYIADTANDRIRKVDAITHDITTVAGCSENGYGGDGGPATSASLYRPTSITVDSIGNLYIADTYNNRIRRVDAITQNITTIAGGGTKKTENGIPATEAYLYNIRGICTDKAGDVYIADRRLGLIRKVDHLTGLIQTVAGGGSSDNDPFLNGIPATEAFLIDPWSVVVDSSGNLYFSEPVINLVRKVDAQTGLISTVLAFNDSNYHGIADMAIDTNGNLLVSCFLRNNIYQVDLSTFNYECIAGGGYSTDDLINSTDASLFFPVGIAINPTGDLLITEPLRPKIRKVYGVSSTTSTLHMKPGWNMVTLPELTDDRINSTWTDLLGGVTPVKVVAWSAQNSKYFNLADPVTYNQALWYKMNSDLSIPYESYHQMVDIPILLYGKYQNGWNLVGNPFPIPVYWDVDRIHVLSGNQTLTLREAKAQGLVKDYGWTWDGSKYRFVCDPEIYSVSNYTQVIPPFGGIWIKSTADCQIVFNSN